jgi:ABC-type uncharacterized transport system fused permease/ATPase subunit
MKREDLVRKFCNHVNKSILKFSTLNLNIINDYIPLLFHNLITWDQQGPPTFDVFENNDSISKFMGLREGMLYDDHKARFTIELNNMA